MSDELRDFARRIESIEREITDLNADKSSIYREAKDNPEIHVPTLRAAIAYRRKRDKLGHDQAERREALLDEYVIALDAEELPSRARARAKAKDRTADPAPAGQAADESPAHEIGAGGNPAEPRDASPAADDGLATIHSLEPPVSPPSGGGRSVAGSAPEKSRRPVNHHTGLPTMPAPPPFLDRRGEQPQATA